MPNFNNIIDKDRPLILEVFNLMNELNFEVRDNLDEEKEMQYRLEKDWSGWSARFGRMQDTNQPVIAISEDLRKELFDNIDTKSLEYKKAISLIAHEYVHYLQKTPYPIDYIFPDDDFKSYILQPYEFEAWVTQSYYFLKQYNVDEAKTIMQFKKPLRIKKNMLINAYLTHCVPNQKIRLSIF